MLIKTFKNVKLLPAHVDFKPMNPKSLKMIFSAATSDVLNVLENMLQLNPIKRCTCREVFKCNKKYI